MPRAYSVSSEAVAVTAAQDLMQVKGVVGKLLRVLRVSVKVTDTTLPTGQMLQTRCRSLGTLVTDGSGGTTPTPQPFDRGDAAAGFTALANNTTKATTSGVSAVLAASGDHAYNGYDFTFANPPAVGFDESFVFELLSTPTGTLHLSTSVDVEESGG